MLRNAALFLLSQLGRRARRAGRFLQLIQRELESPASIPLRKRLLMYANGFFSASYVMYQFDKNDPSLYLSDFQRDVRTPDVNGVHKVLLNDKLLFGLITRNLPAHEVASFGVIRKGRVAYISNSRSDDAASYLTELLQSHPRLVIKPVVGGGGSRVHFLLREGEQLFCNGSPLSEAGLRDLAAGMNNDLVTVFAEQDSELAALYPRTVNTLRLLTMWDVDTGEPFIAAAALRIGRESSYPVDSFTQGGLCAAVDLETGRLSKAVGHPRDHATLTWHAQHPDSRKPIEGFVLPRWQSVKARMLEVCHSVPYLVYVGWDLVLTADGFKILEGNSFPALRMHQIYRPLLADPRVVRFYKTHHVL